jgi:8-oxo-dGTP diphosphatase
MNRFRVAQKVLLFNRKDEVLLLRSAANELNPRECWGKWDFPGGGIEWGEDLEQGLDREIAEEIGAIKYRLGKPLAVWDWIFSHKPGVRTVCILYAGTFIDGQITLSREHDLYRWTKVAEISKHPLMWPQANRSVVKELQRAYIKKKNETTT